MSINSISEAEVILARYIPKANELLGRDITLSRMLPLMKLLGNPQNQLKIIHVAGTSGKTSTSYYISRLLSGTGKKVGLTVSPHLDSITERVQIDSMAITELDFCKSLSEFLSIIDSVEVEPSYFELLMAFAYWYFAKQKVDYAVIETGLGGLHDASNVAGNSDKICVITDIGMDHTHVLGNSITEIAGQKAGIIKPLNQVFINQQSPAVMEVFKTKAQSVSAILNVLSINQGSSREPDKTDLPNYQKRNWQLAYFAFKHISERDSLPSLTNLQLQKCIDQNVPGRLEVVRYKNKTLIMDGAHNQQKITAFVQSFCAIYPGKKASVLLALKQGKDYQDVLPQLLPICDQLIITTFDVLQDMPSKSIDPMQLASYAKDAGFSNVSIENNSANALQILLKQPSEICIITGSFYLLSCLRPLILNAND